jgi:hypothetical protein
MLTTMSNALAVHAASAAAFLETAAAIPDARWNDPREEGKWSPAEVAAHLVTSYEVVIGELKGGAGMAIRTTKIQQLVFRLLFGWRILLLGRFPRGIRAPKETRPPAPLPKDVAIVTFRERAGEFEAAARAVAPGAKLSHAYFGRAAAADGILLCARHIEHHRQQIVSMA